MSTSVHLLRKEWADSVTRATELQPTAVAFATAQTGGLQMGGEPVIMCGRAFSHSTTSARAPDPSALSH